MDNSRPASLRNDVDPQIRWFLTRMAAGYAGYPELPSVPVPEARRIAEAVRAQWVQGGPEIASSTELKVGSLETHVRILRAQNDVSLPALVYLHGGGWTLLSIDTHDRLMREYAARAGVAVVGVDYSRSPEAKYPRALEETVNVIDWLELHGGEHGIDPSRLAVGGDSAGANLSVASQLCLRALGRPVVSAMLLNYGVYTDQRSPSWSRYDGPSYMLEAKEMIWFWNNYLRSDADREDPLVMPLLGDLSDMPPTYMAIAECDVLADGNRAMATALRNAGVETDARVYKGATHSFLEAISISDIANQALEDASGWLKRRMFTK
ncbi:MAG: alpha/beta hydrolase fold domain-containing protein [Rhodanobacteraceae bacterium]